MPTEPNWIAQGAAANTSTPIDVVERAATDITTTTTADPSTGTTLAVTSGGGRFPQTGTFKVRVEAEVMAVSAGAGTNSWTVARGQDGTTNVAHAIGVSVALVVGVQRVEPVQGSKQVTFLGRAATFRTTGRAGTVGQKLLAIHNSATSPVIVELDRIKVDVVSTAVRAITVEPALIRLWKFTVVPTNGTALAKVALDSKLTTNSAVTVWGDASADKTLSATTLTITLPAGQFFSQEYGTRNFTAVGQESADKVTFLEAEGDVMTLRPLEGVCVFLDYNTATFNPVTDFWTAMMDWTEYTEA